MEKEQRQMAENEAGNTRVETGTRLYVGSKLIRAFPATQFQFYESKGQPYPNQEDQPGYIVIYSDGYKSWSPKRVFEEAYRLVSDSERKLF